MHIPPAKSCKKSAKANGNGELANAPPKPVTIAIKPTN
jgi:hypothetical protein